MRLFVAVEVSQEINDYFLKLQKKLTGAKLTLTKSFHLTLKFLGEVTPAQADEIKKRLSQITFTPFTATLDGSGVFPENGTPRVVWIGIEPQGTICALQKNIESALKGMFAQEKDFKAHITLARVKEITDKKFAENVKNLHVKPLTFDVKEFKLIESQLTPEGPKYREVKIYK
ncbi:MAG: RNA 2',3'-cyclic phosphodiesterase [Candidatus Woesearchaeota archaeon]